MISLLTPIFDMELALGRSMLMFHDRAPRNLKPVGVVRQNRAKQRSEKLQCHYFSHEK